MLGEPTAIEKLATLLAETDQATAVNDLHVESAATALAGEFSLLEDGSKRDNAEPRPLFRGQVTFLGGGKIVFNSDTLIRGHRLTARVQANKSARGELILRALANLVKINRRSGGGYEYHGKLLSLYPHYYSVNRIFAEHAARYDVVGWNEWHGSLTDGITLQKLNLRGLSLAQFDLSCARFDDCDLSNCNLSGTDFSGADLSRSKLEGANVDGADFFGAILAEKYAYLLTASGLLEKDSVELVK